MNIWRSLKGLPRDVWVLAISSLINRAGTMVLPFLVLYLTHELGFSAPRAGLALAVYGAGSIIAAPISGRLTDRIGPLPIMRISLLFTGVLLFLFPLVRSFYAVIGVTLVWAITTELFRPANLALIADIVPPEKLKPAYALMRLAINLGMSIGPAAAGFIAAHSFSWIFVADGATTLAAAAVLIATPMRVVHHRSPEQSTRLAVAGENARARRSANAALSPGALSDRSRVLSDRRSAAAVSRRGPASFTGILWRSLHAEHGDDRVHGSAAQRRDSHWPHRRGLALGAFLFAIGSGAFAFSHGAIGIILGMIVWTFGEMLLFPQASAYVAEIAPQARRGQYMGAYSLAFSLAFAVAPWAGTTGYARFGARALWIAVFLVGGLSAWMMARVREREAVTA